MSLQNKYLPDATFKSKASICVNAKPHIIFPIIRNLDFSDAKITYWLFRLRGIPVSEGMNWKRLEKLHFFKLEEIENEAIIVGLIGQFWTLHGNLLSFAPEEFRSFSDPEFAKATWEFRIIPTAENQCTIETTTRIQCLSKRTRRVFKWYWIFIKPFSDLTRYEILRSIKRQVKKEASHTAIENCNQH